MRTKEQANNNELDNVIIVIIIFIISMFVYMKSVHPLLPARSFLTLLFVFFSPFCESKEVSLKAYFPLSVLFWVIKI